MRRLKSTPSRNFKHEVKQTELQVRRTAKIRKMLIPLLWHRQFKRRKLQAQIEKGKSEYNRTEIMKLIRETDEIIADWDDEQLKSLLKRSLVRFVLPKEILVHHGEPSWCTGLIVVLSGVVIVTSKPNQYDPSAQHLHGPCVIGAERLLTESPAEKFIVAATAIDCILIHHSCFTDVVFQGGLPEAEYARITAEILPRRMEVLRHCFQQTLPLMRQCWICRDMPQPELVELITKLQPQCFFPGSTIIEEGTFSPYMYFLRRGTVEVLCRGSKLCQLKPGVSFGEMCVLFAEKRTATVKAVTCCDVWVLHQKALQSMFHNDKLRASILAKGAEKRTQWLRDQKSIPRNPLHNIMDNIPALAHCPRDVRDKLISLAEPKVFPQTSIIASTSEQCDGIYIVVRGDARVQRRDRNMTVEYGGGSFFGQNCFVHHRWPFSIAAITMVDCWKFPLAGMENILRKEKRLKASYDAARVEIEAFQRKYGQTSIILGPRPTAERDDVPPPKVQMPQKKKVRQRTYLVDTGVMTTKTSTGVPVQPSSEVNYRTKCIVDEVFGREYTPIQPVSLPNYENINGNESALFTAEDNPLLEQPKLLNDDPDFTAADQSEKTTIFEDMAAQPSHRHKSYVYRIKKSDLVEKKRPVSADEEKSKSHWLTLPDEITATSPMDPSSSHPMTAKEFQPVEPFGYKAQVAPRVLQREISQRQATAVKRERVMPTVEEAEEFMESLFIDVDKDEMEADQEENVEEPDYDYLSEAIQEMHQRKPHYFPPPSFVMEESKTKSVKSRPQSLPFMRRDSVQSTDEEELPYNVVADGSPPVRKRLGVRHRRGVRSPGKRKQQYDEPSLLSTIRSNPNKNNSAEKAPLRETPEGKELAKCVIFDAPMHRPRSRDKSDRPSSGREVPVSNSVIHTQITEIATSGSIFKAALIPSPPVKVTTSRVATARQQKRHHFACNDIQQRQGWSSLETNAIYATPMFRLTNQLCVSSEGKHQTPQ